MTGQQQARETFQFYTRVEIPELTGISAKSLEGLVSELRKAPDAVIYYHTHHFLLEHHFLITEPANDFAIWVTDTLGDAILGERLASIDTYNFSNLGALKERLLVTIEEHVSTPPHHEWEVDAGNEFHFIKSLGVILKTPYEAHNLREFVDAVKQVSVNSLYYHMFASKLRLARGQNDFSAWLSTSLDEAPLGQQIAHLDPYFLSLEGLRTELIRLIERRLR